MIVKLLIAVKFGSVNGPAPVQLNMRLEEDVVVKLLTVPEMYGPFNVKVNPFRDIKSDEVESVSVPPILKLESIVFVPVALHVRLK